MGQLEKGIRNCTKSIEHSTRSSTQSPTGSSSIAGLKTPLTTFLTMKRTMTLYWTSKGTHWTRAPNRLRISEFTQNFWVFSFYIADFWQTFWVIRENGSNWSNLRLKMSFFALGRLKNHKVPHLHPNSTMFMPLNRLQLKIYAFSGKFNVCSKRVLLSWIKICSDFTLHTQIFTQKYRSWLRFFSEFLSKKLTAGGSAFDHCKVVFSWGKIRQNRFSPNPLISRFWTLGFSISTLSYANFKKIHRDKFNESRSMFLPIVRAKFLK